MKKLKVYSISMFSALLLTTTTYCQTNVFDDVIATSPNHTYLEAALLQENLAGALQNPSATLTVFAPDDAAFTALAAALNTDINGLLALPNLDDILLYHVLGTTVPSTAVTNGAIVSPLSPTNTLKLTLTGTGNVFANHAQVTAADLNASNGTVHVTNAVLLPNETVADVAIDNGFSTLVTAVVTAELLPALTNPLANYTVFAPTNQAFDNLATALNTTVSGLLALPNLADVLTYHVLGTEVPSSAVTNGAIVQPLSSTNTLKLTATSTGNVFVNQAQVTSVDI
ncbi:MAG: fasciclin domain-containing protein, partial [Bacteroidota bacterium]